MASDRYSPFLNFIRYISDNEDEKLSLIPSRTMIINIFY